MISEVTNSMIRCHADSGMLGPLTMPFASDESKQVRDWVAKNKDMKIIWWFSDTVLYVMTETPEQLVEIKLRFMNQ
jgi:hypothetical protein